jgi:hypothetical protein
MTISGLNLPLLVAAGGRSPGSSALGSPSRNPGWLVAFGGTYLQHWLSETVDLFHFFISS